MGIKLSDFIDGDSVKLTREEIRDVLKVVYGMEEEDMEPKTIKEVADKYGLEMLKSTWFGKSDDYSLVAEGVEISIRAVLDKKKVVGYNGHICYPDGTTVAIIDRIPLEEMVNWIDRELNIASEDWT